MDGVFNAGAEVVAVEGAEHRQARPGEPLVAVGQRVVADDRMARTAALSTKAGYSSWPAKEAWGAWRAESSSPTPLPLASTAAGMPVTA